MKQFFSDNERRELLIAIEAIRGILSHAKPSERMEVFSAIHDGYCPKCGTEHLPCYCWNDD